MCILKCPIGRVISAPNFGSYGPGFESRWRRNLADDYKAFHSTESFIITLSSSRFDFNNVARDKKDRIIIMKQNFTFLLTFDLSNITKTRVFKYIENFTTKKWQFFR